jgi:hypothetical protein
MRMIHNDSVRGAVESLRSEIAQQISIFGKCKFLVNTQNLNWTSKACFMEKLPLGSLGLKKLAIPESSFTKSVVFQILNCTETKPYHVVLPTWEIVKFIPDVLVNVNVGYRKFEWRNI